MRRKSFILACLMLSTVHCHTVSAQRWVGPNGLPVINPNSGIELDPEFLYYANTGRFAVVNVGANGVVDSPDNATLDGDDYGMISFLISIANPETVPTRTLPELADGIAWATPVNFNGKIQLSGNSATTSFLPISTLPTTIFQLPAGLQASDFLNASGEIVIETGANFSVGTSGGTLFSSGDPIASGAFRFASIVGDFDDDQDYDCDDIDSLVTEIANGTNNQVFDLTGDGLTTLADRNAWLALAGAENLASGNPYLLGDANLDGVVDVRDFNLWNANEFTGTGAWCQGDFNADGVVDISDFNIWNGQKVPVFWRRLLLYLNRPRMP